MCFQHAGLPHTLVLEQCTSKTGILLLTFGLVFGKVAAYRNGEHRTYMDFRWPIGQPVYDTRARIGHHTFSLHYLASPAYASQYSANDSHVLAVLPTRNVWDEVLLPRPQMPWRVQSPRCYHGNGGVPLCCLTCSGVKLHVLTDPDFLRDLQRPRSLPGGLNLTKLLARNIIWHRTVEVSRDE